MGVSSTGGGLDNKKSVFRQAPYQTMVVSGSPTGFCFAGSA